MNTLYLNESQTDIAGQIIKRGGLVAIPTETVYGLAADATDSRAIAKIYEAKGRPSDNPLIVHVCSKEQFKMLVREFPEKAEKLIDAFCPGPLTIVLPKTDIIPKEITGGLDTVAIRFPAHKTALEIIRKAGVPLAAPSANISGSPSPTTADHVKKDLSGKIDAILDGGRCEVGLESTVITLACPIPRILRPGGVTPEQIRAVIGEVEVDSAVINPLRPGQKVLSPGMKYKHYSPKANIILLKGSDNEFISFVNGRKDQECAALCYDEDMDFLKVPCVSYGKKSDFSSQAQGLFDALRAVDRFGIKTVYARCPQATDIGLAVYNRLIRAAGFEVIDLEKM